MSGDDLIAVIDKWRQQGRDLRKQLISEREILAAKVAEIDKRLAALPTDPDDAPSPRAQLASSAAGVGALDPHTMSTPELVTWVIQHATRPLTAAEIIDSVKDMRSDIAAPSVHSAIYRLKERTLVDYRGDKGSRVFVWKGGATQ